MIGAQPQLGQKPGQNTEGIFVSFFLRRWYSPDKYYSAGGHSIQAARPKKQFLRKRKEGRVPKGISLGGLAPFIILWGPLIMAVTINCNVRLSGEYFHRAKNHIQEEMKLLEEQVGLSPQAQRLYRRLEAAYIRFQQTKLLRDALECARIRG